MGLYVRFLPAKFFHLKSNKICPIYSYRQLLDCWQLWHQRALFDISLSESPQVEPKPSQVYARCNFCNTTLELGVVNQKAKDRTRYRARSQPIEKMKVSGCPSCKKPLPHCSICLLPLNCLTLGVNVTTTKTVNKQSSKFDEWFAWCQNCKHGGHSQHVSEWFANHTQCPVSDCQCNCGSL